MAPAEEWGVERYITKFDRSRELGERAQRLIPGGAHTYSKGDDQFPYLSPPVIERAKDACVWDADGNQYLDWGSGLGSVLLGHGYSPIVEAVIRQLPEGANYSRPSVLEGEYADRLSALIPSAEMVKFAKNGSTVTTAAVKLARAHTGRDLVAFPREHPFFSYDDWFIGSTACPAGVPMAIRALSKTFRYNDLGSLEALFASHPDQIACVIMEPANVEHPREGYLQAVAALCRREGAVFILDEMITGFRWDLRGAQAYYGVRPDLTTFGKGMGNGFSLCALIGRREIMELGGIRATGKERVFLISTTHGGENHGLAAGLAVLDVLETNDVSGHIWRIGRALREGTQRIASACGLGDLIKSSELEPTLYFDYFDAQGTPSLPLKTLFAQEMIGRGILFAGRFVPTFSHTEADVERTLEAYADACAVYKRAVESGTEKFLVGEPVKPVFRQYN